MSAIFISHSSADNAEAAEVHSWLQSKGQSSVFLDFDPENGIPAGRNWEAELYRQLRACRAVIVLCSRASMSSKWVFAELTHARALGKSILPVKIEDCTIDTVISEHQIVDMTEDTVEAYERLWRGLLAVGVDPSTSSAWDGSRSPYPGLLAFQEEDAAVFFGRSDETIEGLDLLNRVRRQDSGGFVMVLGASGSGKSSFVRAGLVPRLRRDPERWLIVDPFRPRIREVAGSLSRAFANAGATRDWMTIRDELRDAIGSESSSTDNPLLEMAHDLAIMSARPQAKVLLVVDQFEELLGYGLEEPLTRFLGLLREAADQRGSPIVLVGTMRSDFLGAFQNSPALLDLRYQSLSVGPLSADDITQVIEKPAELCGLDVEAGLAALMVADTEADNALPLLAFTLREMYERYGATGEFEIAQYRDGLGGLTATVAKAADEVIESEQLDSERQDQLRRAFLAMVRLTEEGAWARRMARWDDLPDSIHPVLERFVAARLLVSSTSGDGHRTLEVAHEALFRSWRLLTGWLDQNAQALLLIRELQTSSHSWEEQGRTAEYIWRGGRLARAIELEEDGELPLATLDREFIEASRKVQRAEAESEEKLRRRRLQIAAVVATGATVLALVALVFFFSARREANRANEQTAIARAGQLAAQSKADLLTSPVRSMLLAVEAVKITPRLAVAEEALRAALADPRGSPLPGHQGQVRALAFNSDGRWVLTGSADTTARLWDVTISDPEERAKVAVTLPHSGQVWALDVSPDGRWAATGQDDGAVHLWNLPALAVDPLREPIPLTGHDDGVEAVVFSDDGRWLATAGRDRRALLWAWEPGAANPAGVREVLSDHDQSVLELAFSPDGRWLASGGGDKEARLWDLANPTADPRRTGHDESITAVAFTEDGRLATGSGDTVRLWDVNPDDPEQGPRVLDGHAKTVTTLAVGPDGWLASGSDDNTVRLWNVMADDVNQSSVVLRGHTEPVTTLAFGAQGLLASGSEDNTVRLWDVTTTDESAGPLVLRGHDEDLRALGFSPDGDRLATGGADGSARLWSLAPHDLEPTTPVELAGPTVRSLAFSPDGRWLAAGGSADDASAQLWDLASPNPAAGSLSLAHDSGEVGTLAFGPEGRWLATGGGDSTARLWDVSAPDPTAAPRVLRHEDFVKAVAFSPTEPWLATASDDRKARLWKLDAADPAADPDILPHEGAVQRLAFSPTGPWLATGSDDANARLWNLDADDPSANPLILLHDDRVRSLAFSPDGRWLATGSWDATVKLWDVETGDPAGDPLPHPNPVVAVAFNHDGSWLATGSRDETVRLWRITDGRAAADPIELSGRSGFVRSLAFSPDGRWLAAGRDGDTVHLWDVTVPEPADQRRNPIEFRHAGVVNVVAFSQLWLASGSEDGTVRLSLLLDDLIDHACASAGSNFSESDWEAFLPDQPYEPTCPRWPTGLSGEEDQTDG